MIVSERQLGRYRLLRLLGRGGMGEVYLASVSGAAGFQKLVTVKVLVPQLCGNPQRVNDLLREAFIGVRLDHENIVQVFDLGEDAGRYFVVMEYVRGFSLFEVLNHLRARGEMAGVRPAVHIVRSVADALAYLHNVRGPGRVPLGLMHRDVSPSNVLLGAEGRIKLSDFGVAALARDQAQADLIVGKPRYLSPEALAGAAPTQAGDVYALGVVLNEMLAGESRDDVPPGVAAIAERAIHKQLRKRYATADAMRDDLDGELPRAVDDHEIYQAYIQGLYASSSFCDSHSALPHPEDLTTSVPLMPTIVTTVARMVTTPLRFGMSPALGAVAARERGERVAERLETTLGRPVHLMILGDYRTLIDVVVRGQVDFAWMPPVAFVSAMERGAGAVVVAQRFGRPSYESAIVVRTDSAYERLIDLRGCAIAWVDRESAAGYLYPLAMVIRELGPPAQALGDQHFQGSHSAVLDAVLKGWVAAGATYALRDETGAVCKSAWDDLLGARAGLLRPIAFSAAIPGDNIAHCPGLPVQLIDRLAGAFLELATDEEGRQLLREVFNADGMVRPDPSLYDEVVETLELVASCH